MKKPNKKSKKKRPGRKAEMLQVDGNWEDAVKSALQRGKPASNVEQPVDKQAHEKD